MVSTPVSVLPWSTCVNSFITESRPARARPGDDGSGPKETSLHRRDSDASLLSHATASAVSAVHSNALSLHDARFPSFLRLLRFLWTTDDSVEALEASGQATLCGCAAWSDFSRYQRFIDSGDVQSAQRPLVSLHHSPASERERVGSHRRLQLSLHSATRESSRSSRLRGQADCAACESERTENSRAGSEGAWKPLGCTGSGSS